MASTKIIIKVKDQFYLQEYTYTRNSTSLILGSNFFNASNLNRLQSVYPSIFSLSTVKRSKEIFQNLIDHLLSIDPNLKLESLYSVIDSTLPINLMKDAFDASAYVGGNLLNYYFIEVDNSVLMLRYEQLLSYKKIPNSGIEIVHIRAPLADFESDNTVQLDENNPRLWARTPKGSKALQEETMLFENKKAEKEVIQISNIQLEMSAVTSNASLVNDFFLKSGIYYSDDISEIKVLDIEQGWRPASIVGMPIYGGGYNHYSTTKRKHGTNTQNVLFKTPSLPTFLSGLCRTAKKAVASTWFSPTDERREAALVASLVPSVVTSMDIILLELQIIKNGVLFPVEIEKPIFQAIETAINTEKYIILEAAGNGLSNVGCNLNTYNYSSIFSSGGIKNLSIENSGAIMIGAATNPMSTLNTCNYGNRVNYYCFGNMVPTASGISYSSTSLASAIMAALVVHLQNKSYASKSRTMKNAELKGLLNIIFPAKVPTNSNIASVINSYISNLS